MNISLPGNVHRQGSLVVLVTGGRDFTDEDTLFEALDQVEALCSARGLAMIVLEGGALGADRIARDWVKYNYDISNVSGITELAMWGINGRSAGPQRNQRMIDQHHPDICIAMPRADGTWGAGTADMMARCRAANIPVYQYDGEQR